MLQKAHANNFITVYLIVELPYSGDHAYLGDTGCEIRSPVLRCETPPLKSVVGDVPETPKTI